MILILIFFFSYIVACDDFIGNNSIYPTKQVFEVTKIPDNANCTILRYCQRCTKQEITELKPYCKISEYKGAWNCITQNNEQSVYIASCTSQSVSHFFIFMTICLILLLISLFAVNGCRFRIGKMKYTSLHSS